MKTIFDKPTRDELISRINLLNENNTAQWGKMTLCQMLKHCALFEEMILGRNKYKQAFIGRVFGKIALKDFFKGDRPMKRNMPTSSGIKIKKTVTGDIESEKNKWTALLEEYSQFSNHDFIHPFFGKMTPEQMGRLAYKHTDHHLRQFNG